MKKFIAGENENGVRLSRFVESVTRDMPRSLLLVKREMPDIDVVPYPVTPDTVDLSNWWRKIGTGSLLALEYCKYLYAFVRVW